MRTWSPRSTKGFLKGDLTGVVPLLAAATAKPYLLQAAREAFVACCGGEADEAALLLEGDGVDGNAPVDPDYEHDEDDSWDAAGMRTRRATPS